MTDTSIFLRKNNNFYKSNSASFGVLKISKTPKYIKYSNLESIYKIMNKNGTF